MLVELLLRAQPRGAGIPPQPFHLFGIGGGLLRGVGGVAFTLGEAAQFRSISCFRPIVRGRGQLCFHQLQTYFLLCQMSGHAEIDITADFV